MSKKHRVRPGDVPVPAALAPAQPEPQSWQERAWAALRSDEWLLPLSLFAGSRIAVLLMATLFIGLVPAQQGPQPDAVTALLRWDGGWYNSIASQGYQWSGPDKQSNVAFFPLYPLLAKIVSLPLLGNTQLALLVVSNIAFLFYLYYLYKLAKRDFDPDTAGRTLLYVAIFCLSFFFSAGYTESLMLALATASFYYAREGNWKLAIALGFLTTLTRLAGLAILLPLAWEWYKQKGLTIQALALLIVPAGLVLFMLYLWGLTGDPLAFNTVQQAWKHVLTWPWGTFGIGWDLITRLPLSRYVTSIAWVDFGSMILFLALICLAIRYMPPAYWLFSFPVYFISTSSTLDPSAGLPTASIARYLMALFPAFILMGLFGKNKYIHYAWVFINGILLGALTIYFFAGIWVE